MITKKIPVTVPQVRGRKEVMHWVEALFSLQTDCRGNVSKDARQAFRPLLEAEFEKKPFLALKLYDLLQEMEMNYRHDRQGSLDAESLATCHTMQTLRDYIFGVAMQIGSISHQVHSIARDLNNKGRSEDPFLMVRHGKNPYNRPKVVKERYSLVAPDYLLRIR